MRSLPERDSEPLGIDAGDGVGNGAPVVAAGAGGLFDLDPGPGTVAIDDIVGLAPAIGFAFGGNQDGIPNRKDLGDLVPDSTLQVGRPPPPISTASRVIPWNETA